VSQNCTIGDVAREAKVSISTVSNLLNGRANKMTVETRARVEAAITRLGYRPSRAAQSLKIGRASLIGVLVPTITNPSYGALARAVDAAARDPHGYRMILGNTYREPDEEQAFLEDLLSHGARGVIVMSSSSGTPAFSNLVRRGLVAVSYDTRGITSEAALVDHVSMDNVAASRIATEHLLYFGHKRIVFLTAPGSTISREDKIAGFRAACAAARISRGCSVMVGRGQSCHGDAELVELGRELAARVVRQDVRPTAAIAINDMLAAGFMAGLRDLGVAVPEEMSVIGMDDLFLGTLTVPQMTSVHLPVQQMSRVMVDRIMRRLSEPGLPLIEALYPPVLISRASVGPPIRHAGTVGQSEP
jgi:DNA-binding LacI/PurR family transcriptional regulator